MSLVHDLSDRVLINVLCNVNLVEENKKKRIPTTAFCKPSHAYPTNLLAHNFLAPT